MPTIRKLFLLKLLLGFALAGGVLAGAHAVQAGRIPGALLAQADRAADKDQPDAAIHYLRQYLEFRPTDTDVQERLVGLMKQRSPKPTGDRLAILDKILLADPNRPAVRKDALSAALWLGRYAEAVRHGSEVVARDPKDADAWYKLAVAHERLQKPDDARKAYESALQADPADPVLYQRYAEYLWRELKQPADARQVLERLVAALPDDAEAYLSRARFDAADGDVSKALGDVRKALELDPDNAEALAVLADHYQRNRQPGLARECLAAGLAKYPADVRLVRSLAWLDLNLGNTAAAVAVLEAGLARLDGDPARAQAGFDLMLPLADLLVQAGDAARGADFAKRLEARAATHPDPNVKRQAKMQAAYLRARLAMSAQDWPAAAALLTELRGDAAQLPGLETQANLLLAVCQQRQVDPSAEQETLKLVVAKDPNHLAARVGLAQSLLNAGRLADAVGEFEAAARSPFAGFSAHSQLLRLKARILKWQGGRPADWLALDAAAKAAGKLAAPSAFEPKLLEADLLAARGEYKPAAQRLRVEATRRPGDPRAWAALADAVAKVGGVSAGLAVLDEGQAAAGDGPDLRLARADLYARDPARLRPLDKLAANIDGWPDADQTRLLYGLVEVFDRLGDDGMVLQTYQRIAVRRPADASVWEAVGERAARANDANAMSAARTNLGRIDPSGKSLALVDAWAAVYAKQPARPALEALQGKFGTSPARADVCVAAGRLAMLAGDVPAGQALLDRAARLEPGRLSPVVAALAAAGPDRTRLLLGRIASDPKWAGEPFRRAVSGAARTAPANAPALLAAARPYLEREPDGLGWVGDQLLAAGLTADALDCFRRAADGPLATADDSLRLAVRLGPLATPDEAGKAMLAARTKLDPALYYAACASFADSPSAPPGWAPDVPTPAERKLYTQGRLALRLGCYKRAEAIALLEDFSARPGPDAAWAARNLAMLLAVRGGPGDRQRAMQLLARAADGAGETPDEKRTTAAVLTALSRHLDGRDREDVLNRATLTLRALVAETMQPRDAYLLAQLYRASGRQAEVLSVLNSLLKADPTSLEFHVMGLEVLSAAGMISQGEGFADRLKAFHPGDFRAISAVARFDCQAGRPDRALVLAEGYLRTADPAAGDLPGKSARVAELLDELARRPGVRNTPAGAAMAASAVARYESLIPNRPDALVAAAGLLGVANRHADAFALIDKHPAAPPRLKAAAGLAAVRTPGATDAQVLRVRAWLDAAKAAEPDSAAVLLNEGEFAALRGDEAGAERAYEAVLAKDPRNVVALNNLAWLLAPRPDAAARTAQLVDRAVAEAGLTGELLDTRARVRITAKQFELAEKDLAEALAQEKTPLRLFHLALAKDGRAPQSPDAVAVFKQAKDRGLEPKSVHPADLPQYRALDAARKGA